MMIDKLQATESGNLQIIIAMKQLVLTTLILLFISCGGGVNDYSDSLSGGYHFVSEARYINYIVGNEEIPCNVIGYAYTKNYILACQEFNDSECILYTQHLPQFAARNRDKEINFWIIDIKRDSLLGPLNYAEYLNARKQLNIDKNLRIKVSF